MNADVIIIGAGLSGLCCAKRLHHHGVSFALLEASDGVGGRIRTDMLDGFRLDRGFQVFLDSYPEAQAQLNYQTLELKPMLPGALVRYGERFHELADPWRRPMAGVASLFSPIGSLGDKLNVARFRQKCLRGTLEERLAEPETTSLAALESARFSSSMIDRFFRPFLGGIFLDSDLQTSSRMLSFVFRMFSLGRACLPAQGMEAIPRQLAASLPSDRIHLNTKVARDASGQWTLADGQKLRAKAIVVATEGPQAAELLGQKLNASGQGTTCLYFAAPRPPVDKPLLVLNGEGEGPINSLCVPTIAAPSYGPGNQSLVSVSVRGSGHDAEVCLGQVRSQLEEWFGNSVRDWRHLRTYDIKYALPTQIPPALSPPARSVRREPGIYACGDHLDNASIHGAMVSGRRAAEAVLADLGAK